MASPQHSLGQLGGQPIYAQPGQFPFGQPVPVGQPVFTHPGLVPTVQPVPFGQPIYMQPGQVPLGQPVFMHPGQIPTGQPVPVGQPGQTMPVFQYVQVATPGQPSQTIPVIQYYPVAQAGQFGQPFVYPIPVGQPYPYLAAQQQPIPDSSFEQLSESSDLLSDTSNANVPENIEQRNFPAVPQPVVLYPTSNGNGPQFIPMHHPIQNVPRSPQLQQAQNVHQVGLNAVLTNATPPNGITARIQQIPAQRAFVYNDLGASARNVQVDSKQEQVDLAFQHLKQLVVPQAVTASVSHANMTITYEDATGQKYVDDLQKIVDERPEVRDALEALESLIRPVWGGPIREHPIEAGKKSSSGGPVPMQRTNEVLKELPSDKYADSAKLALQIYASSGADQTKQEDALKRITAVEKILVPQLKAIKAKLVAQEASLAGAAGNDPLLAQINTEINKLKGLQRKLEVDRLALYVAAAFSQPVHQNPEIALANAKRAAFLAKMHLQMHIDEQRKVMSRKEIKNETIHKFDKLGILKGFNGDVKEIPDNKDYSTDVAALIFSSLPVGLARRGASEFWQDHNSTAKADVLEDELIRFAMGKAAAIPMLDKIVADVNDANMRADLAISLQSAQNILSGAAGSFPLNPFPANATTDAKIDHLRADFGFDA